ncbi:MAG: hypothetical protein V4714_04775 [Bacteroidota bacterium]
MAKPKQFLVEKDDPLLEHYAYLIEAMLDPSRHTLVLATDPDVVERLEIETIIEIIAVAEHYPVVLNKILFGIDVQFRQFNNGDLYLSEMEWKSGKVYYRWFWQICHSLPFAFFFMMDYEARFYCIAGDFLYEGDVEIQEEEGRSKPTVGFTEAQSEVILYRVFFGCVYFMHYCFGTKIDPQPAVEAIIAEFNMEFSFEQVRKEYRKQRAQGMIFRLGKDE